MTVKVSIDDEDTNPENGIINGTLNPGNDTINDRLNGNDTINSENAH